jgi:hypothetical protein
MEKILSYSFDKMNAKALAIRRGENGIVGA